jgi:hypothetical protein
LRETADKIQSQERAQLLRIAQKTNKLQISYEASLKCMLQTEPNIKA